MTIGKIAKKTALNVQTIRFYERAGLLEEARRTPSGYRQFAQNTVQRIEREHHLGTRRDGRAT